MTLTRAQQRKPLQLFRIASLLFPSAVAWEVASMAMHRTQLDDAIAQALGPLWLATAAALVVRGVDAHVRRAARPAEMSWLDAVDVLTASGSAMAWTGAAGVLSAVWQGWASLSVVGLFGLSALHIVALWTLLRAGGFNPWRRASLHRAFVPERVVEGESVTEEVRFVSPRIPPGFRLFASGRVGPRWPLTRYVATARDASGEVLLESDLGPAVRGEHEAEPLEVWLQDVLGLCHSPRIAAGQAQLTVLPKPIRVEDAVRLLDMGRHGSDTRTARRLPTDGSFHLREYQQGDDVRRIHWLRSLTAQQVIVRLPEELPVAEPSVRLVLDTYHPDFAPPGFTSGCRSPGELLDAMVRVWLGIGRALLERGLRVSIVTGLDTGGAVETMRRALHPRSLSQVQELGARIGWQRALAPAKLVTQEPTIVVSHRLPVDDAESDARWVVVPSALWTTTPEVGDLALPFRVPHPFGSADNRLLRTRDRQARNRQLLADHANFRWVTEAWPSGLSWQARRTGNVMARPAGSGRVQLEVLR